MRKFLLLTTMLVASICAMAQNVTVYFVNDAAWETVNAYAWSPEPNANWPGSPATLTSETCKGAAVYSFDVDYSKTTKIIFNDGSAQTDDLDIDPAKPYCYGGQWFATLAEIEDAGELVAYFLHGSFASSNWASVALVENNGVWSIDALEVAADASFGVKRTTNGLQDAWYWTVAGIGTDVSATGTYEFGEEKTATTGGNASIKAGTYSISFDPATLILTVTASGSSDEGGSDEGEGGDDIVPTSEYYMAGAPVEGTDWVCGENWNPAGCPLENGTKEFANLPAGEYKFKITNGAWPNAEGTGGSCWGFADLASAEGLTEDADANVVITLAEPSNVSVSFDGTLITVVITPAQATDLEETDAEDAVVAAFDITGKPVAADAAGIVILQYASGKAVKVINN